MAHASLPRDPCEPPFVHVHRHGPAHVLGRVHRHGTARLAHRLAAARNGCLPGSKTLLAGALLKLAAPVAGLVALGAVAASVAAADPGGIWYDPGLGIVTGGAGGTIIIRSKHHKPVAVPEPPDAGILLAAALTWAGLRRWVKPG